MRIAKLFTCVVAALVVMLGAGCSGQNIAYAPALAGGSTQAYAAVAQPETEAGRTRSRRKVRFAPTNAPLTKTNQSSLVATGDNNVQFVYPDADPAPASRRRPGAREQQTSSRPAVPSVEPIAPIAPIAPAAPAAPVVQAAPAVPAAPVVPVEPVVREITPPPAAPVAPVVVAAAPVAAPVAAQAVVAVKPAAPARPRVKMTKYASTPAAQQAVQAAGVPCNVAYRRGRRVKVKAAATPKRPAGYVPYVVTARTPAQPAVAAVDCPPVRAVAVATVPCPPAGAVVECPPAVAVAVTPVQVYPMPLATYTPLPLPEEPDAEPAADAAVEEPSPFAEVNVRPDEKAAEPIVQPIIIQPIIQPIIQASAAPQAQTAAVQVQMPYLGQAPVWGDAAPVMPLPVMPTMPVVLDQPVLSEPLSRMAALPDAAGLDLAAGGLNSDCPPEICPVPSLVVCGPGQNPAECYAVNSAPRQTMTLPLPVPQTAALAVVPAAAGQWTPSVAAEPATEKYQTLAAPALVAPAPAVALRPSVPPEVSMPAPLATEAVPPVAATVEIESALDAMLASDARTPILK